MGHVRSGSVSTAQQLRRLYAVRTVLIQLRQNTNIPLCYRRPSATGTVGLPICLSGCVVQGNNDNNN